MIHIMDNEWKVFDYATQIATSNLFHKLKQLNPVYLTLDDFAYKELSNINVNSHRYISADVNYPLIAVDGMPNPLGKRYRMIDGRHRLLKQINLGNSKFLFYILQYDDIKQFICKI